MKDLKKNWVCELLGIKYPIIQAGMVWVSGAKLAAACANNGILGVIGAGSMNLPLLEEHIKKAKSLTSSPLAVNLPLLYSKIEEQIEKSLELGIKIFITSAGSPKLYTQKLRDAGCIIIHVVSTPLLAKKCEDAGVHMVVAEGFEAGGHNGRDEITTMCLVPQVVKAVSIPVIAAGGIAKGQQILAAFALGAHGVQIGTRFVATEESSAHENYKKLLCSATPESTELCMKKLIPVRLFKNKFYTQVKALEEANAPKEELLKLLGKGRAKLGMLDGDLIEGELEIGQACSMLSEIRPVKTVIKELILEYNRALDHCNTNYGNKLRFRRKE